MTNTLLTNFLVPRDEREDGFTLIEILVVIIIIGILAAVAIPIFLNQQRTARDSATTSDVRNLATNVETGLVADPEAATFALGKTADASGAVSGTVAATDTTLYVKVGTGTPIQVSKTKGTVLSIAKGVKNGEYIVKGSNPDGQEYKGDAAAGGVAGGKFRVYDSAKGGIQ